MFKIVQTLTTNTLQNDQRQVREVTSKSICPCIKSLSSFFKTIYLSLCLFVFLSNFLSKYNEMHGCLFLSINFVSLVDLFVHIQIHIFMLFLKKYGNKKCRKHKEMSIILPHLRYQEIIKRFPLIRLALQKRDERI